MSRFIRNSLFGTIAGVASTLTNFLTGLIVARLLGVEGSGMVIFVAWVVGGLMTLISAGLPFTLSRYLPEAIETEGKDAAQAIGSFLLRRAALLALVPCVLSLAAAGFLAMEYGQPSLSPARSPLLDPTICALVGLSGAAQALGEYAKGYLRGTHQFARVAVVVLISCALNLTALAIGSYFFGVRGAVVAAFIGSLVPLYLLREIARAPAAMPLDLKGRIFRYTRFRWASETLNFFVWSRIEVFFLFMFWGPQPVGLFGASLTLANLAVQGPLMLTWSLLPHMSEKFGRKDLDGLRSAYAQGTRIMAFIAFPACIGLAALMSEVMPLLYGSPFAAAVPIATVLVVAGSVSATAIVGANLVWAMDRSDVDFYISLVSAALSVAGAFALIMPFGEFGAAASRIIVQMVSVGLGVWFLVVKLRVELPLSSLARLLISALLCAGVAYGILELVSGLPGLAAAILAAIPVYLVCVRLTAALKPEDVDALSQAAGHLPGSAMRRLSRLVRLLHPVTQADRR